MTPQKIWKSLLHTPVSLTIALICIGAWLVTAVQAGSLRQTYYESALADAWTLWGPDVLAGDYWRAVAAMFMHLDLGHLAANMFLLLFVGREVERTYGSALYAVAYLAGGCGASAAVLWMDFQTPTVGASGALYALMMILIAVSRKKGFSLRAPIVLVAANLAYTLLTPNVSLWGHLGGFVAGLAMLPFVNSKSPMIRWGGVLAVLAIALGLIWGSTAYWG